jgi:hypothetical protein
VRHREPLTSGVAIQTTGPVSPVTVFHQNTAFVIQNKSVVGNVDQV